MNPQGGYQMRFILTSLIVIAAALSLMGITTAQADLVSYFD